MHYKFPNFIILAGLVITAVLISGCATGKISHAEDVFIYKADIYEDGDELVIRGQVKRGYRNCCESARGHIDIALLAPDGFVIDAFSILYSPHNIPKRGSRSSRFKVQRPYLPPDGLTIRIAYHSGLKAADSAAYAGSTFDCEKNMAIPQNNSGQYFDVITKERRTVSQKSHKRHTHGLWASYMR